MFAPAQRSKPYVRSCGLVSLNFVWHRYITTWKYIQDIHLTQFRGDAAMSGEYEPLFNITGRTTSKIVSISAKVASLSQPFSAPPSPRLRRANRIRSIKSSLAIEANSLSLKQVTDVIKGKPVLGPERDILEVKNAYAAYLILSELDPYSVKDLLRVHKLMTDGLVEESGRFRSSGVGVFSNNELIHMAPPAGMVRGHITNLLNWVRTSEWDPLVKSCVFHYEFEFIHPFADGNGRMGRLWHTLLLSRWNPVLEWVPVESMIEKHQEEYYQAINQSTERTDSGIFVEFMLNIIDEALNEFITDQDTDQDVQRARAVANCLSKKEMTSLEIMEKLGLSHRKTFRDNYLNPALDLGLIEMTIPEKPTSKNQRYRLRKFE